MWGCKYAGKWKPAPPHGIGRPGIRQAALQALGSGKVDAVITDLNMPNMNGFELIRALRANPAYKFTPILMLTTEGDASKKEEGKAAGATGWIVKPFNPEKLVEVVKKVCPLGAAA